jgi:hypothetical protein
VLFARRTKRVARFANKTFARPIASQRRLHAIEITSHYSIVFCTRPAHVLPLLLSRSYQRWGLSQGRWVTRCGGNCCQGYRLLERGASSLGCRKIGKGRTGDTTLDLLMMLHLLVLLVLLLLLPP